MSKEAVRDVLQKATEDPDFRQQLLSDPDEALKPWQDQLTEAEIEGLKAVSAEVLEGVEEAEEAWSGRRRWYVPSGFKEAVAAVLTLLLAALVFWALAQVVRNVGTQPSKFKVGGETQTFSTYDRSMDILNIVLPLFSGTFAFWFGTAIESRRADENKKNADDAQQQATRSQRETLAVLDQSDKPLLAPAMSKYPGFFTGWGAASSTTRRTGTRRRR